MNDNLPPSDLDAEAATLGSFVLADESIRAQIRQLCQPWMFLYPRHAEICKALYAMDSGKEPIDGGLLYRRLKDSGVECDPQTISTCIGSVYSAANGPAYAKRVSDSARRRAAMAIAGDLSNAAADMTKDTSETLGRAISEASRLLQGFTGTRVYSAADLVELTLSDLSSDDAGRFLKTHLGPLDDAIVGLERGGNTIIAARPSMGKSTLTRQLLSQMAMAETPVGLISLEEGALKVGRNVISHWGSVANSRIRRKNLDPGEMEKVAGAAGRVKKIPLYVVDSVRSWSDIEATARLMVARHGCQAIALDHIHLIDGFRGSSETERTTAASHAVKWLWKSLDVAGLTVCQLSRPERGAVREPTMTDLRNSGELEQDADTIILLHRESYYRNGEGAADDGPTKIIVAKQRDGVRNVDVTVNTVLKYCRFEEQMEVVP